MVASRRASTMTAFPRPRGRVTFMGAAQDVFLIER
jgi:hypothetical protein